MPAPVRVLIADDSSVLRRLLRDAMHEVEGVEVVAEVVDGEEAVAGVRSVRPDVLVLDLQMPRKGGLAALEELAREALKPYVIVLTNHADPTYRDACLSAGADGFFDKSGEIDRVLDVLRQRVARA
jgi:SARP family transcriptional regulator, regulator of embCAB operon